MEFRPSETVNDVFQRLNNQDFIFDYRDHEHLSQLEKLKFSEMIEFQSHLGEMTELSIAIIKQFCLQFPGREIVHISLGNNLKHYQLNNTIALHEIKALHLTNNIKTIVVSNLLELISIFQLLVTSSSTVSRKALVLMEGLYPLFQSQKPFHSLHPATASPSLSLHFNAIKCIDEAAHESSILPIWITTCVSTTQRGRLTGGFRGGSISDPFTIYCKTKIVKVMKWSE